MSCILILRCLIQVLGESLCLTTNYLEIEEKVGVVNSKLESVEAESWKLRKDLIEAMDKVNRAKEKIKELNEALKVEKLLVVQKDEEVQVALLRTSAEQEKVVDQFMKSEHFSDLQFIQYFKGFELLRRWTMKHHSLVVDFSNLSFEKIDTKILTDKAKELEETDTAAAIGGVDVIEVRSSNLDKKDGVVTPAAEWSLLLLFFFTISLFGKHWLPPCFEAFNLIFEYLLPLGFEAFI